MVGQKISHVHGYTDYTEVVRHAGIVIGIAPHLRAEIRYTIGHLNNSGQIITYERYAKTEEDARRKANELWTEDRKLAR